MPKTKFIFQCLACNDNLYFREDKLIQGKYYKMYRSCVDCGKPVVDKYIFHDSRTEGKEGDA